MYEWSIYDHLHVPVAVWTGGRRISSISATSCRRSASSTSKLLPCWRCRCCWCLSAMSVFPAWLSSSHCVVRPPAHRALPSLSHRSPSPRTPRQRRHTDRLLTLIVNFVRWPTRRRCLCFGRGWKMRTKMGRRAEGRK